MAFRFFLLFIWFSCYACKERSIDSSRRGFYFWQATYQYHSTPNDSLWLSMKAEKLYLRCFDIGWSQDADGPVKKGALGEFPASLTTKEIVPVVFISNKTFQNVKVNEVEQMAVMTYRHIRHSISQMIVLPDGYNNSDMEGYESRPYGQKSTDFQELAKQESAFIEQYKNKIKEVQFDCDWTPSTREKYFAFLKKMKVLFAGKSITCTVRLYAFKYPKKAGIPPVDKGMLMCYNAGDIKDVKAVNSLFNKEEVLAYLEDADKYPLALDAVLPMFCWAVHYRNDKLQNILSIDEIENYYERNFRRESGNLIAIKDFNYGDDYNSIYIREGDVIRVEETDMEEVEAIIAPLKKHMNKHSTLAFFHITKYAFDKHSEKIRSIFNSY